MVGAGTLLCVLGILSHCLALRRLPHLPEQRSTETVTDGTLEVVQAATPPRSSFDGYNCKQTIIEHDFANSYGKPYVAFYYPPPGNCTFTTTIFNLSVVSKGRQYDRLAQLFFGDVEIWRTSTAMPTETGIHWSFQKDMTVFDTLLRKVQKVIFDLGNVVDGDLYTGIYNLTLEAMYFNDEYSEGLNPADLILPISNLSSAENSSSVFSLPDDSGAVTVTLPRNIKTAVVSLMASGNSAEEFWYTNVPSEYVETFPSNEGWLYGYSPFREVQLLIDDRLAGVSWPFPILFTGGVDPGLWRPVVGIDTYELPSFEIDVTPFLSLLCDGAEHTFKIQVVGFDSNSPGQIATVGQNWWVTGTVFVWLDDSVNQTVAGTIHSEVSAPIFDYLPQLSTSVSANGTVTNESLWVSLSAYRTISISSTITSANETRAVSWTQELHYSNVQNMTNPAYNQSLTMTSSGTFEGSFSGGVESSYSYPLNLYSAYVISEVAGELSSVFCMIDRSLLANATSTLPALTGTLLGPESLATRQNVTSFYAWNETIVEGVEALDTCDGETWYSLSGSPGSEAGVPEYSRYLKEVDDTLVADVVKPNTISVPATEPLPLVEGEPHVYNN
ncbi:hypothetical protein N8I77_002969 [Diaporthe amygdali]|uniref:Peptide N-acetyl-beta-D-glucosaminyl asparaginase amidase A N-terminal domain-containing protein n=1 Tax=Phomopsis amygdali TaxID=1214568 RepID=A0AAD9W4J8_PHOAM|nr:hypothetical protein N8I77_002969 [Diaporthe amygdali]